MKVILRRAVTGEKVHEALWEAATTVKRDSWKWTPNFEQGEIVYDLKYPGLLGHEQLVLRIHEKDGEGVAVYLMPLERQRPYDKIEFRIAGIQPWLEGGLDCRVRVYINELMARFIDLLGD